MPVRPLTTIPTAPQRVLDPLEPPLRCLNQSWSWLTRILRHRIRSRTCLGSTPMSVASCEDERMTCRKRVRGRGAAEQRGVSDFSLSQAHDVDAGGTHDLIILVRQLHIMPLDIIPPLVKPLGGSPTIPPPILFTRLLEGFTRFRMFLLPSLMRRSDQVVDRMTTLRVDEQQACGQSFMGGQSKCCIESKLVVGG